MTEQRATVADVIREVIPEEYRRAARVLVLVLEDIPEAYSRSITAAYDAGTRDDWAPWRTLTLELHRATNIRGDGVLTALGLGATDERWVLMVPLVTGAWQACRQ